MTINELDVIMTSTTRPQIIKTIASFKKQVRYAGKFRFVLNIDTKERAVAAWLIEFLRSQKITHYQVNSTEKLGEQAHVNAINYLLAQVVSPVYLHLEDDWIFKKPVDLSPLVALMIANKDIHHLRFSKERILPYAWLYYLSDDDVPEFRKNNVNCRVDGVPFVKTHTWSFNPSLARTDVARKMLPCPIDRNPEQHMCFRHVELYGDEGKYILGQIGDSATVADIGRNKVRERARQLKKWFRDRGYLPRKPG